MTASAMIRALRKIEDDEALDKISKDLMPLAIDESTGILTANIS